MLTASKKVIMMIFLTAFGLNAGIFDIYGIGQASYGFAVNAMGRGGSGIAVLDSLEVYKNNPAALSVRHETGFEVGLNAENSFLKGNPVSQSQGFSYAVLSLPVGSKSGMQFSLTPMYVSNGGLSSQRSVPAASEIFNMDGSIYRFQLSGGHKISNSLSVGAAYAALFGGYELSHEVEFDDVALQSLHYSRISGTDGRQFSLGMIYSLMPSLNMALNYEHTLELSSRTLSQGSAGSYSSFIFSDADTVESDNNPFSPVLTLGLSYNPGRRIRLSIDMSTQLGEREILPGQFGLSRQGKSNPARRLSVGLEKKAVNAEYASIAERTSLQTGIFLENSYLSAANGAEISTLGAAFGFGLPFNEGQSRLNMTFIFGRNQGNLYNSAYNGLQINEDFFRLQIGLSSFDRWFNTKGKYR